MIVLFDFDSLIYKCAYFVCSNPNDVSAEKEYFKSIGIDRKYPLYLGRICDLKQLFANYLHLDWQTRKEALKEEITIKCIDRLQNMEGRIFEDIEQTGCSISAVEYYLTTCSNSFRKALSTEYKANRKRNKWVGLVRNKVLADYSSIYNSDTHEADDLIAARAKGLQEQGIEFLICSLDKDLQQIEGMHYNYYRDRETGEVRGLKITTKFDSFLYFWKSLLTGDSGDRISGVKGIGEKKAAKILEGKTTEYAIKRAVLSTYLLVYGKEAKEQLELNYKLLKLGI